MHRIMVIDDDTVTLRLVEQMLINHGYQVVTWSTSAFAMQQIEQEQPDLVVLDHHLGYPPTGWGILQDLRFNDTTSRLPVILCSADLAFLSQKETLIRGMGADVLTKPIDFRTLITIIERMLGDPTR